MYYVHNENDSIVYVTKSPVDADIHAKQINGARVEYDEGAC